MVSVFHHLPLSCSLHCVLKNFFLICGSYSLLADTSSEYYGYLVPEIKAMVCRFQAYEAKLKSAATWSRALLLLTSDKKATGSGVSISGNGFNSLLTQKPQLI